MDLVFTCSELWALNSSQLFDLLQVTLDCFKNEVQHIQYCNVAYRIGGNLRGMKISLKA